jgi:hypothetical protein
VAYDSYTWIDSKTILTLDLYPQQDYSATLVISDKTIQSKVDELEPYVKIECEWKPKEAFQRLGTETRARQFIVIIAFNP